MPASYLIKMTLDAYLLAALSVLLTGISKSGFAGGLGILGVPLVALALPPQEAASLLLPILIAIDLLSVWRFRRNYRLATVLALLPGAALGIGIGMAGFARLDADVLRLGIGLMALTFAMQYFIVSASAAAAKPASSLIVFLTGAVSGFAGFVAHAGGPPVKGTFLRMGLEKSEFVGTNAVFFCALNMAKAVGYAMLGLFTASGLIASVSLAPFVAIGVAVGFALHKRVLQTHFTRLAYILLAVAGANLTLTGTLGLAWP